MPVKPRLAVDFDGTIYDGQRIFPGCIEALTAIRTKYIVAIFSARQTEAERQQMKDILDSNRVPYDEILGAKPEADFYLDDKGVKFESWLNLNF